MSTYPLPILTHAWVRLRQKDIGPSLCKVRSRRNGMTYHFRKFTPWLKAAGRGVREVIGEGQGELASRKNRYISIPHGATGWLMPVPNA